MDIKQKALPIQILGFLNKYKDAFGVLFAVIGGSFVLYQYLYSSTDEAPKIESPEIPAKTVNITTDIAGEGHTVAVAETINHYGVSDQELERLMDVFIEQLKAETDRSNSC